jgi:hypothetical protein
MAITRETVARKPAAYFHHEISLDDLVDWAQLAMMEGEFEGAHHDVIGDSVARLGLADVRAFGLTWEDCETILKRLGKSTKFPPRKSHVSTNKPDYPKGRTSVWVTPTGK